MLPTNIPFCMVHHVIPTWSTLWSKIKQAADWFCGPTGRLGPLHYTWAYAFLLYLPTNLQMGWKRLANISGPQIGLLRQKSKWALYFCSTGLRLVSSVGPRWAPTYMDLVQLLGPTDILGSNCLLGSSLVVVLGPYVGHFYSSCFLRFFSPNVSGLASCLTGPVRCCLTL